LLSLSAAYLSRLGKGQARKVINQDLFIDGGYQIPAGFSQTGNRHALGIPPQYSGSGGEIALAASSAMALVRSCTPDEKVGMTGKPRIPH
jgi:hypothetical protein